MIVGRVTATVVYEDGTTEVWEDAVVEKHHTHRINEPVSGFCELRVDLYNVKEKPCSQSS